MNVREKISSGLYHSKLPYGLSRSDNDKYYEDVKRLEKIFYIDCCNEVGLNPDLLNSMKIFNRAWSIGHSSGYNEVYLEFVDLVEFLTSIEYGLQ